MTALLVARGSGNRSQCVDPSQNESYINLSVAQFLFVFPPFVLVLESSQCFSLSVSCGCICIEGFASRQQQHLQKQFRNSYVAAFVNFKDP